MLKLMDKHLSDWPKQSIQRCQIIKLYYHYQFKAFIQQLILSCKNLIYLICQMDNQQPIKFYYEYKPHGYLSNFYPSPFKVGNITYRTNEHYFQSKKFEGKERQQQIIDCTNTDEVFKLGQYLPRRGDWEEVKENYMYEGLKLKFSSHPNLLKQLLETGDRQLIEHTHKDNYWADGGDGSGKNRLGVLLMKLRDQIRSSNKN